MDAKKERTIIVGVCVSVAILGIIFLVLALTGTFNTTPTPADIQPTPYHRP